MAHIGFRQVRASRPVYLNCLLSCLDPGDWVAVVVGSVVV